MDLTHIAASRILAAHSIEHAESDKPGHIRAVLTALDTHTGKVSHEREDVRMTEHDLRAWLGY